MEVLRPKVVLISDFECCRKYKHTLPLHIELISQDVIEESCSSEKNLKPPSKTRSTISKLSSTNDELTSELSHRTKSDCSSRRLVDDDPKEMIVEETFEEEEFEAAEVEGEYESSICSEWVVLKPDKRRRKKEKPSVRSLISDLTEPAGSRRLVNRPPSPDGEAVDLNDRPNELISHNFIKYQDMHMYWPEPPPFAEALLQRHPSPAVSMPKCEDVAEVKGEDWLWFEGHYVEGGALEIPGENGGYYRLPKQWKEGYWMPSTTLLEKWEKEEEEAGKGRQKQEESRRKYNEVLKRPESPGMDIMNWGNGPVKLENWIAIVKDPSSELSQLLSQSESDFILEETSKLRPQELDELTIQIGQALSDNSFTMVRDMLMDYFFNRMGDVDESDGVASVQEVKLSASEEGFNVDEQATAMNSNVAVTSQTKSVKLEGEIGSKQGFSDNSVVEADVEDATKTKVITREVTCDFIPEPLRDVLLEFIRHFVTDLPDDPLQYAIGYFADRIPPNTGKLEQVAGKTDHGTQRRMAIGQNTPLDGECSVYEKSKADVDKLVKTLNDCWFTKDLDLKHQIGLIGAMFEVNVKENRIVQFANENPNFFVIKKGAFSVESNQQVYIVKDRGFIGEYSLNMMLSQNFPSPYQVTALTDGALWCLRNRDFSNITSILTAQKETLVLSLLDMTNLFNNATDDERYNVMDTLETRYYTKKDIIFCQNSAPEGVYFILKGTVKLVKLSPLTEGTEGAPQHFSKTCIAPGTLGHSNMIESKPWDYSCVAKSNVVEVAILKTDVFDRLFGDVDDLLNRHPPHPKEEILRVESEEIVFNEEELFVGEDKAEEEEEAEVADVVGKWEGPEEKEIRSTRALSDSSVVFEAEEHMGGEEEEDTAI